MKSRTKILIFILSSVIFVNLLTRGVTIAKYVGKTAWNYYLESKGFYFDSDVLNSNNVDNNWDGSSIHFDVKNSNGKVLASDYDINYKVTCNIKNNDNLSCKLNNTNTNVYTATLSSYEGCVDLSGNEDTSSMDYQTCIDNGYEYRAKETKKDMYFDIESNDGSEINNAIVEIVLESTYPYKKTIISEFILNKSIEEIGSVKLSYDEYDDYSRVVVNNSFDESKCVKITWDSLKLRISNENITDSYKTDNDGYINEILFNITPKSYKNFTFYRVDNNINYTNENFTITQSNEC